MKQALYTVSRIKEMLQNSKTIAAADAEGLAAEYSALCKQASERLALCDRYIRAGQISEAIHTSMTLPMLLDLCKTLSLKEYDQWRNLCSQHNLDVPQQIDRDMLERLKASYSKATALEPIIKLYRKASRSKNLRQCIDLLYRLADLEPDNPNWKSDLNVFEQKRIKEIEQEARKAAKNDDLPVSEQLLAELQGSWTATVPAELSQFVDNEVDRLRRINALTQGKKIVAQLSDAFSCFDFNGAEDAVAQYEQLLQTGYFEPDSETSMQFEEANTWYSTEKQSRDFEANYQADLNELKALVETGEPSGEIGPQLHKVTAYGQPVPDDLQFRAQELDNTWQVVEQRKRRAKAAGIILGSITVALIFLSLIWFMQYSRLRTRWIHVLDHYIAEQNYPALEPAFQELGSTRRQMFGRFLETDSQIEQRRLQIEPVKQVWESQLKSIEDAHESILELHELLDVIAEQEYVESDRVILQHLAEIERKWKTIDELMLPGMSSLEGRDYAEAFRAAWTDFTGQRINRLIARLATDMPSFSDFSRKSHDELYAVARQHLDNTEKMLNAAAASPAALQRLAPIKQELDRFLDNVEERKALLADMKRAENPLEYFQALVAFHSAYPDDMAVANVSNPRGLLRKYEGFDRSWRQIEQRDAAIRQSLNRNAAMVREVLGSAQNNALLTQLFWMLTPSTPARRRPEPFIVRGQFRSDLEFSEESLFADAYNASPEDTRVSFRRERLGRNSDYIRQVNTEAKRPMPHVGLMQRIIADALDEDSKPLDILLSEAIIRIDEHPVWDGDVDSWSESDGLLNDYLKAFLIHYTADILVDLLGDMDSLWKGVLDQLRPLIYDTQLHWLAWQSDSVIDYSRKCRVRLRELNVTQVAHQYIADRLLSEALIDAGRNWLAYSDPGSGQWILKVSQDAFPQERWFVDMENDVAGLRQFTRGGGLDVGDVLLGPDRNWDRAEVEKQIQAALGLTDRDALEPFLPTLWPR